MEYNNKLKELRISKGFFQKDIANKIGVATNTYQSWERGITQPDISNLINLAMFMPALSITLSARKPRKV